MKGDCNLPDSLALDGGFAAKKEIAKEYVAKLFDDYLIDSYSW